jgi:hypothetical protein
LLTHIIFGEQYKSSGSWLSPLLLLLTSAHCSLLMQLTKPSFILNSDVPETEILTALLSSLTEEQRLGVT